MDGHYNRTCKKRRKRNIKKYEDGTISYVLTFETENLFLIKIKERKNISCYFCNYFIVFLII